jgi:hypothetical protein
MSLDLVSAAQKLARNPLGIIALFIVLVYGIAGLVLGTTADTLAPDERILLVSFLVGFPVLTLGVFAWLTIRHHGKLYGPSDFREDRSFLSTLSVADQRRRLEEEVAQLEEPRAEPPSIPPHEPKTALSSGPSRAALRSAVVVAEDLALRVLESELKATITRRAVLGRGPQAPGFDGVALLKDNSFVGVEVRLVRPKSAGNVLDRLALQMTEYLQRIRERSPSIKFSLIVAIVSDGRVVNLAERAQAALAPVSTATGIPVELRLFELADLQRRFGLGDAET